MKTYSKSEIRRGQRELLQLRAYRHCRTLEVHLAELEAVSGREAEMYVAIVRFLAWERILFSTMRLLEDVMEV